jgi:UDP-4-amino-4,6-dideoxy-N-acetyl-beta-L-altrosamine transaminase
MIPYGRQSISNDDVAAVSAALHSDWLTTGPKVAEFESRFADVVGAKYAVAVSNGTAALHLAMLAAGIGPGDRVVTSPNTFLASANCAAYVGATPDFCDIDPVSYTLCPATLARSWLADTRAVVAVDYAGQTADMPSIAAVARAHGAIVIEDACHAIGGQFEFEGKAWKVGGHPWADITTYSFHPVKTMTTGEGGMIVTDNPEYAAKARVLRTHGMVRESFQGLGDKEFDERGSWYYEMQELGFNYRITDIQCALGLSQLDRLDMFVQRRREIVAAYNLAFAGVEWIQVPGLRNNKDLELTSWHLYALQVDFKQLGISRTDFMMALREQGIGSQVLYIPVHLQPWYRATFGYGTGKCPIAEDYYLRTLSLPLYPDMSEQDVRRVIDAVTVVPVGIQ